MDVPIVARDPDGEPLSYDLTAGVDQVPAFASVATDASGTPIVRLAPGFTNARAGACSFNVRASNGVATASTPLTVSVTDVNRPPVMNTVSFSAAGADAGTTLLEATSYTAVLSAGTRTATPCRRSPSAPPSPTG